MSPKISCALVASLFGVVLLVGSATAAPEPRNFLFEDADRDLTTEIPITEPVTSLDYILMDGENNDLTSDNLIAQPSEPAESIVASASSTSSTSSTSNSIGGSTGKSTNNQQISNLVLLQQLQEQIRRQQLLQKQVQQPQQQGQGQQQQPQFSLDALVKSFVKVFQVAKTKIDQGARTVRDILQFFDRKKYTNIIPQGSENNLVLT